MLNFLLGALLTAVPLPEVPSELRLPEERADFIVEHFWEPADSLGSYTPDAVEQAFANFISVFPIASEGARARAMGALVDKTASSPADFAMIAEIADRYLYSDDSPIASEDFYILFLEQAVESPKLGDAEKIRPQWLLEMARKNRPGMKAADFMFVTRDGNETSLLSENARLGGSTLIFYDPDCGHCRQIMSQFIASGYQSPVIAIYSGDDKDLWEQTAAQLPESWTVGYDDGSIQEDDLYIIRTLPAIYILSPDGIVKEKEAKIPLQ